MEHNPISHATTFYYSRSIIAAASRVQQTIAHSRIVSGLGEGGMGTVYAETDTRLGRDVAIKVPNGAGNPRGKRTGPIAHARRPTKSPGVFPHPRAITLYEYGVTIFLLPPG
jgi:hypothetical protein